MWAIAVLLAATMMVQKNAALLSTLEQAQTQFHAAANPDRNLPTSQIRKVQSQIHASYDSINSTDLSRQEADQLRRGADEQAAAVRAYDGVGEGPIQGVYLVRGA